MARIRNSESGSASILHADLDSFFASVEQRDDPRLRGRPVIVGGGVVLAASYEAKAYGVKSAMGGRQAQRLCPDALVVPPRFAAYVEASRAVFAIFEDTTPLVEGISIDEAFLDVGGLRRLVGEPETIGVRLRERVRDEVGLPISVGIARTKYLAKVASAVSKPDGLLRVPPDGEQQFLHPLPVERLWGVGAITAAKLHADGIRTIGELARREEVELTAAVGKAAGRHLWALANLRDPRPVEVGRRRRSIGSQSAIGRAGRPKSRAELEALLAGLVDRVARRLRGGERIGRTFTLRLRFDDFTRVTRSSTIPRSTASTATWLETGRGLLDVAWPLIETRGCTLLGITISGLVDASGEEQLELPLFAAEAAAGSLDVALDRVRDRFGSSSVKRAVLVGRHVGLEMPTLPDPRSAPLSSPSPYADGVPHLPPSYAAVAAARRAVDVDLTDPRVVAFAEQFAVDFSVIDEPLRAGFLAATGPSAFVAVQAIYVDDVWPRVLALLDLPEPATVPAAGELWPALEEFMREVARLDALDPVLTELVRLRGARQHGCRLCASRRSVAALEAGADEVTFDAVDAYADSDLPAAARAALALTDAMIWTPYAVPPQVVADARAHLAPEQLVEVVLDVARNAANKIAVALGADAATVTEGVELFATDADGNLTVVGAEPR